MLASQPPKLPTRRLSPRSLTVRLRPRGSRGTGISGGYPGEASHDNSTKGPFLNKNCPPAGQPGTYQCTPERPFVAFEPWANVTPFVLQDNTQFRPGPPFPATGPEAKADLDEVKKLGGDGKTTPSARTDDQSEIALFWMESSPLKWSRIARTVATDKGLDLWQSARLFAILDMALTDGYIAMVASKNHYNYWRPVTAIRSGGDPSWTPLRPTPPGPDDPLATRHPGRRRG